jgi:hypothetical protein
VRFTVYQLEISTKKVDSVAILSVTINERVIEKIK